MVGATLALSLIVLSQAAWANQIDDGDWIRVNYSDEMVLLVQADGPQTLWARFESNDPEDYPSVVHLVQVDCEARTTMRIQATAYERRNMQGASTDLGREYQGRRPIPGSFGANLLSLMCD